MESDEDQLRIVVDKGGDPEYTTLVMLQTYVYLPPSQIDTGWKEYLLQTVKKRYTHTCIPRDGFVWNVHRIHKIQDLGLTSTSGEVRCLVDFVATVMSPKKGICMDARVDLVSAYGILLSHPYITILVPHRVLSTDGYRIQHDFMNNISYVSPSMETIRPSQILPVRIMEVRYENNSASAIGRFAVGADHVT